MFRAHNIARPVKNTGLGGHLKNFAGRAAAIIEALGLIFIWLLIFSDKNNLGGFSRREIITYILIGNLISLVTGYLLERIIARDLLRTDSKLLVCRPLKYFGHILFHGLGKIFAQFVVTVAVYLAIVFFFAGQLIINLEPAYIAVIGAMVILAFLTEFLIAYLIHLHVFWTIESPESYKVMMRIKKFFAGNYFPLSMLPANILYASFMLPFAYSFFVPTELYLKKINLNAGLAGLGVQMIWIAALYLIVKRMWLKRTEVKKP
jgi:ABC-2 type transport system permease protein